MILRRLLLLPCLLCAVSICRAQITVVDDTHTRVSIDGPARRIVTAAPNLAELVYAAGAGPSMTGTVRGTNYPREASALPIVGDAAGLDFEQILRLKPDLVLAWGSGNRPADLERLARNGIAVVVLEAQTVSDIARHLRLVGRLAATDEQAERAAAQFEESLRELRARYAGDCKFSVFAEIWHQPVFTVGASHPLSDALQVCGARNAIEDFPLLAGPIPLENVLIARADIILSVTGGVEADAQARWDRLLPSLGGRHVPVVSVTPELLVRSGPRMLDGLATLCARIESLRERVGCAGQMKH